MSLKMSLSNLAAGSLAAAAVLPLVALVSSIASASPAFSRPAPQAALFAPGIAAPHSTVSSRLTRAEAASFHPMAVPERVRETILRKRQAHGVRRHRSAGYGTSPATAFVTDVGGFIWELNSKNQVVGELTDCAGAEGAKVDGYGNLWAACTDGSAINMYVPGASSASLTLSDTLNGVAYYPADVTFDGAGNIYVTNLVGLACSASCSQEPGNVVLFLSNQSGGYSEPVAIADANINVGAYFLDADDDGNVYVDYSGTSSSCTGYGLDQISGALNGNPTVTTLSSVCSGQIQFPGGVYTTNFQRQLNVLDQDTKGITEYPIAVGIVGSPVNTLGPIPAGDPVAMGWNQADSQLAAGDAADAAADFGSVSQNTWKSIAGMGFEEPIGAAYASSDKNQPKYVGAYHALIMQALIENLSATVAITGPNPSGTVVLQAMLQLPNIPVSTKNIISELLLAQQGPTSNQACQTAISQFQAGMPSSGTYAAVLAYLKQQAGVSSPCMQYHAAVEDAIAIAEMGKSTIYNGAWIQSHYNSGDPSLLRAHNNTKWWKVLIGAVASDVLGGMQGAEFGHIGIAVGAVCGSAAFLAAVN